MKITAILDEIVPIQSAISNAVISFEEMTVSAVVLVTDVERRGKPVVGFGFHSNGRYAQSGILRERMIPRLHKANPDGLLTSDGSNFDPFAAWKIMMANEKPGGHGDRSVAVGALDMALWDLVAKIEQKPLYQWLADRFNSGRFDDAVSVYAAGGYYYPGKDNSGLQDEMRRYLDLGYDSVKMKIGGAPLSEDLRRIEAALSVLPNGSRLAVDANARFELEQALEYSQALEGYGLKWYEEPVDPLDYQALSRVAQSTRTPIATGENLFSTMDAQNLIRHGGLQPNRDILQMDPCLSYGLVEYLRMLKMLESNGWSPRRCVPHGGHQMALHIAAGLGLGGNESYPGVFQPFGGFADSVPIEEGKVRLPDVPGIGIVLKANLMEVFSKMMD